ncbi:regulator of chromosome condensation-like [Planococcus citri]|uniref:regulator of chromosome condensation-like n=1 Tax=Planococcus citri TaxID=170843 RepID=UPI0031F86F0A
MYSRRSTTKRKSTIHQDSISTKKKKNSLSGLTLKPIYQQTLGSGSVFTGGSNNEGQLGITERQLCKIPTLVENLTDIVDICAGAMHTLCIDKNGKVHSWGCNDELALGRETTSETEAIPGEVNLDEKVVQITAGDSHSAALTETGKVYAWGSFRDSHGEMGLTPEGKPKMPTLIMNNAAKIASGANHLLILSTEGLLYSLGCAEQGQLGRISVRFADRGSRCGLGNFLNPRIIHALRKKKFDEIWVGSYNSFAREHSTSHIYSFGLNNYYQSGLEEEKIYPWPVVSKPFSTNKKWVSICGGDHHTLSLDNTGTTYVLGKKEYGRLGLGEYCDDVQEPTVIPGLKNEEITSISCGSCVSFALTREGEAYGWGMGTTYQLGKGSKKDNHEPKLVSGEQMQDYKIIKVCSGAQHTVFLAQRKT